MRFFRFLFAYERGHGANLQVRLPSSLLSCAVQLKGNVSREVSGAGGDRARRMLGRDCQLMGLTWLLAKNKTAYIPAVSAVLRAMLYTAHPMESGGSGSGAPPRCSPDQENMPLAVDSLQFERTASTGSAAASATPRGATAAALLLGLALVGCVLVSRTKSAGGRGGTLLIQVFCSSC